MPEIRLELELDVILVHQDLRQIVHNYNALEVLQEFLTLFQILSDVIQTKSEHQMEDVQHALVLKNQMPIKQHASIHQSSQLLLQQECAMLGNKNQEIIVPASHVHHSPGLNFLILYVLLIDVMLLHKFPHNWDNAKHAETEQDQAHLEEPVPNSVV